MCPSVAPAAPKSLAKARYMRQMFSRVAHSYDLFNALVTWGRHRGWRRRAAQLAMPDQGRALDVATGTADLALELAPKSRQVVALDLCWPMMERGRDKTARRGLGPRLAFVLGDALRLPFQDNSFDCAATGFALRNVASLGLALAEMRRVVRPGGRVVCLELTKPQSRLISWAYRRYLWRLVPAVGRWLSGQREPYLYLPASLNPFPTAEELKGIMEGVGLSQVRYERLNLGTVAVHVGVKEGGDGEPHP